MTGPALHSDSDAAVSPSDWVRWAWPDRCRRAEDERDRLREALELIRDADWTRAGLAGVQAAAAGALAQEALDA